MKLLKSKTFCVFALTMLMTVAIFAATANVATAATILEYLPTYARISPTPNPIGVGQTIFMSVGLQPVPPTRRCQEMTSTCGITCKSTS